jgi:hypothetical protein
MDILYPMNLPDPLRKILEEHPPTHRSRYGLISADQEADRSGRYFLLIRHGNQAAVCFGRYRLDPPGSVRLMDFESMLDLSMTQAVSLMSLDLPAFDEEAPWDVSRLSLPGSIPRLDREDLTREFQSRIVSSEVRSQYWSEDWTPDFYRGQAKLGCIATSYDRGDQVFLMPELQKSYAILDWHDVRADRGVRKILAGDKPDVLNISLEVSPDPMPAIAELRRAWGSETWLTAPYVELRWPGKRRRHGIRGFASDTGCEDVPPGGRGAGIHHRPDIHQSQRLFPPGKEMLEPLRKTSAASSGPLYGTKGDSAVESGASVYGLQDPIRGKNHSPPGVYPPLEQGVRGSGGGYRGADGFERY